MQWSVIYLTLFVVVTTWAQEARCTRIEMELIRLTTKLKDMEQRVNDMQEPIKNEGLNSK
jgi:hypothetical protein